ncbi:MAG: hypothetical protein KKH98_10825, partial [Spirochaetes bacterium]|nr:hypothetical protein [Spirochaetota bacterium]
MKFKINIKKQWKKMLLFIVISVFIAAFLILSEEETPEPSPIKDDYSVQEILSTLYHNYAKIKNLQMNISTTWIRPVRKNIAIKLNILDTQLTDILDDEDSLKLSTEGVDIGRHADLGLIGYYRSKRYETKFFILINWINKFYKSLILFPRGYKLIGDAAFEDIEVTKLKKKGYYLLETSLKDKRVYANFTVNMQYGAIDELNVVSFQTITNNIEGVVDIPTMINAKFSHYADFKGIVFPQYIRISYFSPVVHYVFHTAVNEASFNQKIEKDQFNLMTAHNRRRWYNDPSWVSSDKLVMIKGTGWEVRDVEGRARKIDQDHYIILKDI